MSWSLAFVLAVLIASVATVVILRRRFAQPKHEHHWTILKDSPLEGPTWSGAEGTIGHLYTLQCESCGDVELRRHHF